MWVRQRRGHELRQRRDAEQADRRQGDVTLRRRSLHLLVQHELDSAFRHTQVRGGQALVEGARAFLPQDAAEGVERPAVVAHTLPPGQHQVLVGLDLQARLDDPQWRQQGRRAHARGASCGHVDQRTAHAVRGQRLTRVVIHPEVQRARGCHASDVDADTTPHADNSFSTRHGAQL